jgi:hypothetical protein
MLLLEFRLQGHPRIAKQMEAHLPNKTAKQIRDKRREATYKSLLQERATALLPEVEAEPALLHLSTASEVPPPLSTAGRAAPAPSSAVRPNDFEADENLSRPPGHADLTPLDGAATAEDTHTDFKLRIFEHLLAEDDFQHSPLASTSGVLRYFTSNPRRQGERASLHTGRY